jgi:hypothetical protein
MNTNYEIARPYKKFGSAIDKQPGGKFKLLLQNALPGLLC